MKKIKLNQSALDAMLKINPEIVEQIIKNYVKIVEQSGITYYISK